MTRLIKMKDQKPLAVKRSEMQDEVVWICRCGLSAAWPVCDGSHKVARTETPGKTYRYHRAEPGGALVREELASDVPGTDPRPDPVAPASEGTAET